MCSKINVCYIFICISSIYAKTRTSNFRKVVWQHAEGVVGSIIRVLLEFTCLSSKWKNFESPLRIDKLITMSLVYYFFGHSVHTSLVAGLMGLYLVDRLPLFRCWVVWSINNVQPSASALLLLRGSNNVLRIFRMQAAVTVMSSLFFVCH